MAALPDRPAVPQAEAAAAAAVAAATDRSGGSLDPFFLLFVVVMPYHRKNTRLASENYFGRQSYFVTVCCNHRAPHLSDAKRAQRVLALLLECATSHSFRLHAYCAMPDNIHILAEGIHNGSNLCEFIRLFKQHTGFEFQKSHGQRLWEASYYDHILRPSDSLEDVAAYIWWNSVRKKICIQPHEYPFSGSQTIDWMKGSLGGSGWSAPWKRKAPA
jgi:REP element-mobilizing transposase RayT